MTQGEPMNYDFEAMRQDEEFKAKTVALICKIGMQAATVGIPRMLREIGSSEQEVIEFMALAWECYFGQEHNAMTMSGGQPNV